jgi:beta-lactamase regulating signal transducer with metallopeptidase domain
MELLGWVLLHSLWQGAFAALLLRVLLAVLRDQGAAIRYAAACVALLLLAITPMATAVSLAFDGGAGRLVDVLLPRWQVSPWLQAATPWLAVLWAAGVAVQILRLRAGLVHSKRLRRVALVAAPAAAQRLADRIRAAMEIDRRVPLLESALVDVPSVVGWLRPVILIPASTLAGLSPAQFEMIVAHELAHIRRRDPWVNLLQTAIEALYFYHPAAWWISAKVRQEREHCCDEAVVRYSGDPIGYARSLTRLERLRAEWPAVSLGSADGSLLERIRRLVMPRSTAPCRAGFLPLAVLALGFAILLVAPRESARATQLLNGQAPPMEVVPLETRPAWKAAGGNARRTPGNRKRVGAIRKRPAPVETIAPGTYDIVVRFDSYPGTLRPHMFAPLPGAAEEH